LLLNFGSLLSKLFDLGFGELFPAFFSLFVLTLVNGFVYLIGFFVVLLVGILVEQGPAVSGKLVVVRIVLKFDSNSWVLK
jgi:hypothetical protein